MWQWERCCPTLSLSFFYAICFVILGVFCLFWGSLTLYPRLVSNLWQSSCFSLPRTVGIGEVKETPTDNLIISNASWGARLLAYCHGVGRGMGSPGWGQTLKIFKDNLELVNLLLTTLSTEITGMYHYTHFKHCFNMSISTRSRIQSVFLVYVIGELMRYEFMIFSLYCKDQKEFWL